MSTDMQRLKKAAMDFAEQLNVRMLWSDTPQGHAFWNIVYRELKRIASGYYDSVDSTGNFIYRKYNADGYPEDGDKGKDGWDYHVTDWVISNNDEEEKAE